MHTFWMNPIAQGALAGLLTAAAVDFQAFRAWKSVADAAQYAWGLALWRWFQGAVVGALSSLSLGSVLS